MQEPHFGAFLHHFSPIPRKLPELEVRAGFGPLSDEKPSPRQTRGFLRQGKAHALRVTRTTRNIICQLRIL